MHQDMSELNITENTTKSVTIENFPPQITVIVNIAFFLLLAVIIIAANLLVLVSIYANPRLRLPTHLLILSLSAADLMVGLFLIPVRVLELLSYEWSREFLWCKMTLSLNFFSLSASLLNLLAVTADRFLAISYALKYGIMITNNRICVVIIAVWLTAFTASFLPLFGVGMKPVEVYRVHWLCRYADVMEGTYMAVFFLFICATPTVLITAAYFKIFVLARGQERRIASLKMSVDRVLAQGTVHKRVSFTRRARESKAAKTTAIVVGLFYFCWSPFFAGILLTIFRREAVSYAFIAITACVVYSNSAINPLVYGCLNQEFKNTYKHLVKKPFHACPPRLLKRNASVSPNTTTRKSSERPTITATVSTTNLESVSLNIQAVSLYYDSTS